MPGRRSSRIGVVVVALMGAALAGAAAVPVTAASPDIGTYLTPFREDGASYGAATDTFTGGRYLRQSTDGNGCVADGSSISSKENPDAYRCLPAGGSLFCSDQVVLANGDILTAGGTDYYSEPSFPATRKGFVELEGIRAVRLFHASTDTWMTAAPMNHGRWYPSLVTLADGRLFVAGGVTKLIKPIYPSHVID